MTYRHIQQCMYLLVWCIYVICVCIQYVFLCIGLYASVSVSVCMCIYPSVWACICLYHMQHPSHVHNYTWHMCLYMNVSICMWYIYVCMCYILTCNHCQVPLDQIAWGLKWDLHVHPLHGKCYSPPKSVAKHTDMHISYLTISNIHIQTHSDTYIHIHDTDIYSQPEPEPTGNLNSDRDRDSVYTSSSSCVKLARNALYQVTHGATATASEWPGPFPNLTRNLENVY